MKITVNGIDHDVQVPADMPLLWVLRDVLMLTGTKYGCGVAQCGACTVLVSGVAVRSCQTAIADVEGEVTTIEGLAEGASPHPVQQAWIDHQVAQCGYCQSGQIMQTVAFLARNPAPTAAQIDAALDGNLCRCGTYPRLRTAVEDAARRLNGS